MSGGAYNVGRTPHGDLGVGKRPHELDWKKPDPFDLGTPEAAEILGVDLHTVATWIRQGKLTAERRGYRYYLRRSDVERLAAQQ